MWFCCDWKLSGHVFLLCTEILHFDWLATNQLAGPYGPRGSIEGYTPQSGLRTYTCKSDWISHALLAEA